MNMKRSITDLKKQIEGYKNQIDVIGKRIEKIQSKCVHAKVTKTYEGSNDNWDPSDNYYQTNFHCHDCDKFWWKRGHES